MVEALTASAAETWGWLAGFSSDLISGVLVGDLVDERFRGEGDFAGDGDLADLTGEGVFLGDADLL